MLLAIERGEYPGAAWRDLDLLYLSQLQRRTAADEYVELGVDPFASSIYSNVKIDERLDTADDLQQCSIDLAPKVLLVSLMKQDLTDTKRNSRALVKTLQGASWASKLYGYPTRG